MLLIITSTLMDCIPDPFQLCYCTLQFCKDVWLMFDNAWLYNKKTSRVYKYCTKLRKVFDSVINEAMESLGYCCGMKVVLSLPVQQCFVRTCIHKGHTESSLRPLHENSDFARLYPGISGVLLKGKVMLSILVTLLVCPLFSMPSIPKSSTAMASHSAPYPGTLPTTATKTG